jgi:hypothetical protein
LHGGEIKREGKQRRAIEMRWSALGFEILWEFIFSSIAANLSSKELSP